MNGDSVAIMKAIGEVKTDAIKAIGEVRTDAVRAIGELQSDLKEDLGAIKESVAKSVGLMESKHTESRTEISNLKGDIAELKHKQRTDDWRFWITTVAIPFLSAAIVKGLMQIGIIK